MSINIFIDISIDILIDTLIDIFVDMSIDIFIGICIVILTDKEEGRGGKEWRSEGVDLFLKSNNPTPEGGEKTCFQRIVKYLTAVRFVSVFNLC